MFRLTVHRSRHELTIRLDGRLDFDSIAALDAHIASSLHAAPNDEAEGNHAPPSARTRVTLELAGLTAIDRAAGKYLKSLSNKGCRLEGGSLYIRRLLEEVEP
jgi:hypothetical protein